MVKPLVLWCCGIINLNIHPQGKVPCHGAVIEGQSTYLRQCKISMFQDKNFKKISVLLCYCFTELLWPRRYISVLVFVLVYVRVFWQIICTDVKIWNISFAGPSKDTEGRYEAGCAMVAEKSVLLWRIIRSLHKDSLHLSRHPYTREFIRVSESSKNE